MCPVRVTVWWLKVFWARRLQGIVFIGLTDSVRKCTEPMRTEVKTEIGTVQFTGVIDVNAALHYTNLHVNSWIEQERDRNSSHTLVASYTYLVRVELLTSSTRRYVGPRRYIHLTCKVRVEEFEKWK